MKYWIAGILLILILAALGPRVDLDESIYPVTLSKNLDIYLTEKESRIGGIRSNVEKTIIWADSAARLQTDLSIVYLHGFSASRQEVAPLCDRIAAALGANLFYTRLTGHGRDSQAMQQATVNALLNNANEAIQIGMKLGKRVIVIASSTGATLSTLTTLNLPLSDQNKIFALIFLSPNFGLKRRESELLLMPWASTMVNMVEGPTYRFIAQSSLQARYWTTEYPSSALIPMVGLIKLTRDKPVGKIKQPLLVLYSPEDKVVNIEAVKNTFSRFGSKNKHFSAIHNSGDKQKHILAGDALSPQTTAVVFNKVMEFINSLEPDSG